MTDTHRTRMLDNPIWSALTGGNSSLATGSLLAKRFAPDVAPFAAVAKQTGNALQSLVDLVTPEDRIALFTPNRLEAPAGLAVDIQAPILQMMLEKPIAAPDGNACLEDLQAHDVDAMLELVAATRPGPFSRRTIEFGRYLGIRVDGRLAAIAGERFRFDRFVEISAVCVAPGFRGKGYADLLIRRLAQDLQRDGLTPILHVFATNGSAILLYEKLGFETSRQLFVTSMRLSA